jgi:Kef-type K+ transport system membrane component KefB
MAIVTPIVTKYLFAPLFRKYIEHHFARYDHISNIVLMILVLCAFISIAAYAGTSVLFGAFLAGTFLSYIPSKHPEAPFVVASREEGEREAHKSPTFVHTFERYLVDVQKYLMEPLFFASVGFAIPFVQLWTGKRIWRGVVFTLLMVFAKVSKPLHLLEAIGLTRSSSSLLESGFPSGKFSSHPSSTIEVKRRPATRGPGNQKMKGPTIPNPPQAPIHRARTRQKNKAPSP